MGADLLVSTWWASLFGICFAPIQTYLYMSVFTYCCNWACHSVQRQCVQPDVCRALDMLLKCTHKLLAVGYTIADGKSLCPWNPQFNVRHVLVSCLILQHQGRPQHLLRNMYVGLLLLLYVQDRVNPNMHCIHHGWWIHKQRCTCCYISLLEPSDDFLS